MPTADNASNAKQPEVGDTASEPQIEEGFFEAAARFDVFGMCPVFAHQAPQLAAELRLAPARMPLAEAADKALARLRKALRRERARGRSGHFTYDLARHLALAQQVRSAEAALRATAFAPPRRQAPTR